MHAPKSLVEVLSACPDPHGLRVSNSKGLAPDTLTILIQRHPYTYLAFKCPNIKQETLDTRPIQAISLSILSPFPIRHVPPSPALRRGGMDGVKAIACAATKAGGRDDAGEGLEVQP